MQFRVFCLVALALLAVLAMTGCTAGSNPAAHVPDPNGSVAGFWMGLWHGLITPITFAISLFDDKVHVYEAHNTGGSYNFGFTTGFMIGLVLTCGLLFNASNGPDSSRSEDTRGSANDMPPW